MCHSSRSPSVSPLDPLCHLRLPPRRCCGYTCDGRPGGHAASDRAETARGGPGAGRRGLQDIGTGSGDRAGGEQGRSGAHAQCQDTGDSGDKTLPCAWSGTQTRLQHYQPRAHPDHRRSSQDCAPWGSFQLGARSCRWLGTQTRPRSHALHPCNMPPTSFRGRRGDKMRLPPPASARARPG